MHQIYRADINFINDLSPLPKKRQIRNASVDEKHDGWSDSTNNERIVQKMRNDEGLQLGLYSILSAQGKVVVKLPAGRYSGTEIKKFSNGYDSHIDKHEASALL